MQAIHISCYEEREKGGRGGRERERERERDVYLMYTDVAHVTEDEVIVFFTLRLSEWSEGEGRHDNQPNTNTQR